MNKWRGKILTYDNAKTPKGEKLGYGSFVMFGAPHKLSGHNACAGSSPGCRELCIYYAGMGIFPSVQQARINRTIMYFKERDKFLQLVNSDIKSAIKWSKKNDLIPCFRLDGTTDIGIAKHFVKDYADIQFYDYTKCTSRLRMSDNFVNWHTTYSLSENTTRRQFNILLKRNTNIAVPFRNVPKPGKYILGRKIVCGDKNDLRFLDGKNKIITLSVKGKGRKRNHPFILDNANALLQRFAA
tara:strand:- start:44 stop:766 length:723 start_codon:yes stop_codon:yes gene_type:complete